MNLFVSTESHEQIRALYQALLSSQERFDEFKRLLQLYDLDAPGSDEEPPVAAEVRHRLNDRIRLWIGGPFEGLSATQTLQWRAIIVDECFNVARSTRPEPTY
jgi:hypothetical protein